MGKATKLTEFQNVNVPKVDYNQLNQRLRCATTDEEVDDIMGTPEGALGPGSIRSLIPSRRTRARKVHNFDDSKSVATTSSQNVPFYNKGVEQILNASQDNSNLAPARQKALFKGRYFVSFGILCAPLAGTEIFPMAPRMEKLHFAVAADMPLDHFDGEPQQQYLDDIKNHMAKVFKSYQLSNRDRYLHRFKNSNFDDEWNTKFPFASHRFYEGNAVRGVIGEGEKFKTSLEANPNLFQGYRENLHLQEPSEGHGKGSKFRHEQLQVVASPQASQRETRLIGLSANRMKIDSSDSLTESDVLGRKFDKFLATAKQFLAKGHRSIAQVQQVPMLELRTFTTYEQFEDWLFQEKDMLEFPNATHEKCLMMAPWDEFFNNTQRIKIAGWMTTLVKFDRIKIIRHKVCLVLRSIRSSIRPLIFGEEDVLSLKYIILDHQMGQIIWISSDPSQATRMASILYHYDAFN